jgi:Omp85 superfamily domain/WD40-like Beta Propeller Repeat
MYAREPSVPPVNRRLFISVCALLLGVLHITAASAAGLPSLEWHSIKTKHFRITYNSGEEPVAVHIADLCEDIFARLEPAIGWPPSELTEIIITDETDTANGSASVLPYNAITLYVTAPDDFSPLGDVDDWYLELVTHEFTHILHIDHTRGLPEIANRIVGKQFAPNQVAPRWLLEGLAVYEESSKTSGGRLRSSMWNMWMRADVLENNIAPLDVMSNSDSIRRWPQGNLKYLYGSYFMGWIAETYGEQAIRAFIDDYGWQVIPFAINRSLRRATGRTFEDLYPAWMDTLKREFNAQAVAIRGRGLREGVRLTHTGQEPEHPRWIPAGTWPGTEGDVIYFVDDGHTRAGLHRLPLVRDAKGNVIGSREDERELLVRTSGTATPGFAPDGTLVFNSTEETQNLFFFNDLFALPPGMKSTSGLDDRRVRLTDGFRALDPDVSPDGRHVVFTTNHRGTQYLQIADFHGSFIDNVHALVKSGEFEQAYTPRFSPDGSQVAYSIWKKGGYRDIRLVDVASGSYVDITHDRAIDGDPSFSKDGRWLLFHSDRTGVSNIYAYELATGVLKQVTNVINGAFQPQLSPDGATLLYEGYTHAGWDVYAMRFDPALFLDALPYEDDRPAPPPDPVHHNWEIKPYNPLHTFFPRAFSASLAPGNFGELATISASGGDIAGFHSYSITYNDELSQPDFQGSISYSYNRLPVNLSIAAYRAIAPSGGLVVGTYNPTTIVEQIGVATGVSYSLPRAFDSQNFSLSYNYTQIGANLTVPQSAIDPYANPSYPGRGFLGSASFGYSYSNAESYLYSVGPERGFSVSTNLTVADPWLGGQFSGYQASFQFATYFLMPWAQHHTIALHASGGVTGGSYPGLGDFYVGGYQDLPIINTIEHSVVQSSVLLRGYAPVTLVGSNFALFNSEYRFPIIELEHGISTLPVFLTRVSGSTFFDYGSAFNNVNPVFKAGTGAELWFDVTLSYVIALTFRLGFEHGLSSEGIDHGYFIAVAAF